MFWVLSIITGLPAPSQYNGNFLILNKYNSIVKNFSPFICKLKKLITLLELIQDINHCVIFVRFKKNVKLFLRQQNIPYLPPNNNRFLLLLNIT